MEKGEIAQNEQFHIFPQCFLCNLCNLYLIATFQLSSAASSNLGQSQNGVLGNGLTLKRCHDFRLYENGKHSQIAKYRIYLERVENIVGKGGNVRQNFRLVRIETNCRRHFKVHLK